MRLLILGAGSCQLNAIIKAKEMGIEVVAADYYSNAPGKAYSDFSDLTSTFDSDKMVQVAKKYQVDGVMTLGTDQPVYTCAHTAQKLSLPTLINGSTAKAVTNKRIMKSIMKGQNIPTAKYVLLSKDFKDHELMDLSFPVVIKPLDSQGQRGVFKLNSIKEVRQHINETLSFSRENTVLIEEFYESDEITVSGWVHNQKLTILTITDRLTFTQLPVIGISYGHIFPTKHFEKYYDKITQISETLVKAFQIQNGPIYFQMLIGKEGVIVNEIACRIGGAYEDELIPLLTGIDILEFLIKASLGKKYDVEALENYHVENNKNFASVQLFFAKQGIIKQMTPFTKIKKLPFVENGRHNYSIGDEMKAIENAAQRAGYMIITGENRMNLERNIHEAFKHLEILDAQGRNLTVPYWAY